MTRVLIEEFKSLGHGYWRINPHGAITFPELAGSEPRIWVSLSQLRDGYRTPFKAESLAQPERHIELQVKVGLIQLLVIGSVWRNGIRQPSPEPLRPYSYANFHWSQFRLVRCDQQIELEGKRFFLFGDSRYWVGHNGWPKIKGAWFAITQGFSSEFGGGLLVIPSTVLFQAFMATSPVMARRLIFGELDKILDEECGFVEGEPSTLKVTVAKEIRSKEDAPAAANIRIDPVAGGAYKLMRQNIVAAQVNRLGREHSDAHVHLALEIPLSRPFSFRASGKHLPFNCAEKGDPKKNAWGFLVTEITDLEVDLPFTRLVVDRKNSSLKGPNANDDELIDAWAGAKPASVEPLDPEQPVTSEGEPLTDLDEIPISVFGGFMSRNLDIVHEPKQVQRYRNARLTNSADVDFEGVATTGDSISSGGTAGIEFNLIQEGRSPLALQEVLNALSLLNEQGIDISTLAVGSLNRSDENGQVTNFFVNKRRKARSWRSISGDNYSRTRGFVVGEIYQGGVWHYFIDIEHKRAGELSMLHLYAEDGGKISTRSLDIFMEAVARSNGWTAKDRYAGIWRFQFLRHTQKNIEGLAHRIKGALLLKSH